MVTAALPLTVKPDQAQLDRLRPLLAGRSCVVVGAAPLGRGENVTAGELVICINGSISSIAAAPDVWFLNSKPNRSSLHITMLRQGRGRQAGHVALLRGVKAATELETLARLQQMHCQITSWSVVDKPIKQWLEETICGRNTGPKKPCSAGLFAVAVALWCGAVHVRLIGFSWTPGYQYFPHAPIRGHVDSDRKALHELVTRYPGRLSGALVPQAVAA